MKNCYYDSPFTVQRLEHEPGMKIYHSDAMGCPHICRCSEDYRCNSGIDESERINEAVAKAVRTEFQKMKAAAASRAARGYNNQKRCPYKNI